MDSHSTGLIIVLILLVFLSAYFSATETAFSSLSRVRLKNMAENGNRRAKLAYRLADHYDELISSILVGNNIVNIAASSIATVLFIGWFQDNGPTVSTIVMTVVILICGEVTPKSIAKESPERFAMFSAPIINVLNFVFKPVNILLVGIKKGVNKLFKVSSDRTISESELLTIVEEAEQEGGINENESELIHNVIEFDDLECIDIFTPRVDVEAVEAGTDIEDIAQLFIETGFSRLPVYEETIDKIIGIINEKDFHNYVLRAGAPLEKIIKPVEFVPPSMKISVLLRLLQQNKSHFAVIVDEFGGTEGIITLEDILEELVGEIWDEHDEIVEAFRKVADNEYLVDCSTELYKTFEFFDIDAEEDASTINGWVIAQLDRIPEVGDSFDYENLHVVVEETDAQRASLVRITVLPKEEKDEDEED
ncbi:MAG: HlyC/CorC family transporter [Clostridia bacterium]|nr:HlyC/CorC family transporter [Clostridia bacterium]